MRRSSLNGFTWVGACALLSGCGDGGTGTTEYVESASEALASRVPPPNVPVLVATNPAFMLQSLGGRCLDFGAAPLVSGRPVVLRDCNRGASQQIIVEEINAHHDVILHAGNKVLGVYVPGANAPASMARMATGSLAGGATVLWSSISGDSPPPPLAPGEVALVLQDPATVVANGNVQVFSFDGDTLMLANDHEKVVKVADGRGTSGTPLVMGPRELADGEIWSFVALDGTGRRPTSAFVRATSSNFAQLVNGSPPGTVIEVDPGDSIEIKLDGHPIFVAPGITIRGGRRGLVPGGEIWTKGEAPGGILDVRFPNVRITGLRLRGPSGDRDPCVVSASGIAAAAEAGAVLVDRCELSHWTDAAVLAIESRGIIGCGLNVDVGRPMNVRVVRNYIHDNARQSGGYGVATNSGGNALVFGNTFLGNRHAIKSGGEPHAQYRAWYNLVLSYAPRQIAILPGTECVETGVPFFTQDFDVHGANDNGEGGQAGQYFEIARNTFLATNRQNFDLRGFSCVPVDFRDNVSMLPLESAIGTCDFPGCDGGTVQVWGTAQFERANPTRQPLGVGDFDGDGRQDLFLATGAAWYYSSAGATEWRLLNTNIAAIADLRLGDFDGDGRTDVFSVRGTDWVVSWGGVSGWEVINGASATVDHLAVGDFDGDKRADVFFADGHDWWVSPRGRAPLQYLNTSSYGVPDLRFGDFNGDGKTDVFGRADGEPSISLSGSAVWKPLWSGGAHLDIANTWLADFNGDGRTDVITARLESVGSPQRWAYYIAYTGVGGSGSTLHTTAPLTSVAAIGSFDTSPGADVLLWNPDAIADPANGIGAQYSDDPALQWLLISSAGAAGWQRYGAGNMR